MEHAKDMSPAGSALRKDIPFTFHQDSPVLLSNVFNTIWCAAKRVTKSGLELSWEERISVEGKLAYLLQYGVYIK